MFVVERSTRDPFVWPEGVEAAASDAVRRDDAVCVRSACMTKVVCPGSFDPVTNGHLDIIERSARLFDEVVVAVLVNENKQGLFSIDERVELLEGATPTCRTSRDAFTGLLVDFCTAHDVDAIVKGLRAVTDFDYELQMAQMNATLTEVDTVFIPTSSGLLVPGVEPGQGGRQARRRRLRARPPARPRRAQGEARERRGPQFASAWVRSVSWSMA